MFTVPVPNPTILADTEALVPVAFLRAPLAAMARLEELVVKLWELDAHTPLVSAELAARTR